MEGGSTILGRNVSTHGVNVKLKNRRQTLCDITNTLISTANNNTKNCEGNNAACAAGPLNYVEIMKQNNQLLKILAEKNKMIELSAFEIQKLKIELQRSKQQNGQLAQSHSQMLAELNLGRDRLKNLQHEVKSSSLVVQQQKKEIKEKNNLIKQLTEKITAQQGKMADMAVNVPLLDKKQKAEPQCKIAATTTNNVIHVEESKPESNNRKIRRLSRAPKVQKVNSSDLASCSQLHDDKRRRSTRLSLVKIEQENQENQEEKEDHKQIVPAFKTEEKQEQLTVKIEEEKQERDIVQVVEEEDLEREEERERRRLSIRPMRRAAGKVVSYKETPLNVKMRRLN
ncbi:hypothetical protein LUZ60_012205 [Juncus effusus]|nr:hypothetical protein LUZ60_012205 [Juncus effusus]